MLATDVVDGRDDQPTLDALDVTVRRNGYGTQLQSFEAPLDIRGLIGPAFPGVFIRAPVVERVGPGVDVLATHDDQPVLVASRPGVGHDLPPRAVRRPAGPRAVPPPPDRHPMKGVR